MWFIDLYIGELEYRITPEPVWVSQLIPYMIIFLPYGYVSFCRTGFRWELNCLKHVKSLELSVPNLAKTVPCHTAVWMPIRSQPMPYHHIIIVKNIGYFLWNREAWRSLNNTWQTFLIPCIRCTNHLCDSSTLSDINQHFIPSLLPIISKCWPIVTSSHMSRPLAIVVSQWLECSRGVSMDAFVSQWRWGRWFE